MAGISSSPFGLVDAIEERSGNEASVDARALRLAARSRAESSISMPPRQALPCQSPDHSCDLIELFGPLGGVAREHEVLEALRVLGLQPLSHVARWIIERRVCHFSWQASIYLPRFQFDVPAVGQSRHAPLPGMHKVLAELGDQFDDWEAARWFATPNPWLRSERPARMLLGDADLVAHAARTDRYIAKGW